MIVTIVGAGNMGRGIATRALAGANHVRLVDADPYAAEELAHELRDPRASVAPPGDVGDVVVLALPYPIGKDVIGSYGPALSGVPVVDISNPVDFETFDSLVVPPGTSAAEEIAAANPDARVVKAFNTTFAATLLAGQVDGWPLDVLVAGDDEAAKTTVITLATSGGMRALDVGPLRRARELEGFQFLHMTLQDRLGLGWGSAIKILSGR